MEVTGGSKAPVHRVFCTPRRDDDPPDARRYSDKIDAVECAIDFVYAAVRAGKSVQLNIGKGE